MLKDIALKINRYKLRNRMVLAYLAMSLLTTLALSLIIYQLLSQNVLNRIGENSLLSLKQSAYVADTMFEQINTVNSQMMTERDLQNFVYATNEDKVITYKALLVLSRLMSVYPFIQSIELYNDQAGMYFNTMRPNSTEQPVFQQYAKAMYNQLEFTNCNVMPRELARMKGTTPESYQVLSFAFRPSSFIKTHSIFVLNLDLKYLQNNILSYQGVGENKQTFIIDNRSIVVTHNDPSLFLADFSKQNYINTLFSGTDEGYTTLVMSGRKCLVSYTRSAELPWYCISIKPYEDIIGGLAATRNIVLLSTIATFVIALLLYLVMTRSIYGPFQRLLDKLGGVPSKSNDIEIFTKAVSRNIWYQTNHEARGKNLFLQELFSGVQSSELDDDLRAGLTRRYQAQSYCILIFKLDDFHRLKKNNPENIPLYQFSLLNIASEVFSTLYTCVGTAVEEDAVALLCCEPSSDFTGLFQEAQEAYRSLFSISISASVGVAVAEFSAIQQSYASALGRMRHRLYEGHGCLLDEIRVQPYLNNDASYPYELESRLIFSVQTPNQTLLAQCIASLRQSLIGSFCDNVHHYAAQFIYSMLKFADSANIVKPMPYEDVRNLYELDTIDDMVQHIDELAKELRNAIQDAQQAKNKQKHMALIENIKHYITCNFNDPNLSLETVAEVVDLSPEYIRKLFKQNDGTSLSHFTTHLRLEKARELLLSTDKPIQWVGEQVGLCNPSHFFTLFKKTYGLTPSTFREQQRKSSMG